MRTLSSDKDLIHRALMDSKAIYLFLPSSAQTISHVELFSYRKLWCMEVLLARTLSQRKIPLSFEIRPKAPAKKTSRGSSQLRTEQLRGVRSHVKLPRTFKRHGAHMSSFSLYLLHTFCLRSGLILRCYLFRFVSFSSEDDARKAIECIRTSMLFGQPVKCRLKTEQLSRTYFA